VLDGLRSGCAEVGGGSGSSLSGSSAGVAVGSVTKLLMVGGRGFGIGFSTGFVSPSFIS